MWSIFSYAYLCLYIFFGEVSIWWVSGSFSNQVLLSYCWILRVLCILWKSSLSYVSFVNIFFYGLSSYSLDIVFYEEVFWTLMKYNLINYFFHRLSLVLYLKSHHLKKIKIKSSSYPRSSRFPSMLSSRSFIILILHLVLWPILNYFFCVCEGFKVCV